MSLSRIHRLSPYRFPNLPSEPTLSFLSFSSLPNSHASTPQPNSELKNHALFNYLVDSFGVSKPRALAVCNIYKGMKTHEKPQSVVDFFKSYGFSDAHIRSLVRTSPQILFADIDKTIEPKLQFFQGLGLSGSDLGKFISKCTTLLNRSLDNKLIPCIETLKKLLTNDDVKKDMIRLLRRCDRLAFIDHKLRFLPNVSYLKSCGIVGSQLSMLLVRHPRLFTIPESELRSLVSRVLDMGFSINSGMLVHAIYAISCMSTENFTRKHEFLKSFGFSEAEFMEMFRKQPGLVLASEEKLKLGIEFFMNTVKLEKAMLVRMPVILMLSLKDRVMPRYKVMQILMSKRLLMNQPSFPNVLKLTEQKFIDKFVSPFKNDVEELLMALQKNEARQV